MKLTLNLAALLGAALALPTGMPPHSIETEDPLQDLPEFQAVNGTNDSTVATDPFGDLDFPRPRLEIICKGLPPYCGSRYGNWHFWGENIRGIAARGHHDKQDQTWGSVIRDLWRFVWKRDEGAATRAGGEEDAPYSDEESFWNPDEMEADHVERASGTTSNPQEEVFDPAIVTARDVAFDDDGGENPCEKEIKPADVFFVFGAYDKGLKCAQWRKEQEEKWRNN